MNGKSTTIALTLLAVLVACQSGQTQFAKAETDLRSGTDILFREEVRRPYASASASILSTDAPQYN